MHFADTTLHLTPPPDTPPTPTPKRRQKKIFTYHDAEKMVQGTLTHRPSHLEKHEYYGDNSKQKFAHHLRFVGGNTNRLLNSYSWKDDAVFSFLAEIKADALTLSEIGLDWHKIPTYRHWYQRHKRHLTRIKSVLAHNCTRPPVNEVQYGRVAAVAINELLPRVIGTSIDPTVLGRWASILIGGKGSHTL